MRNVLLILTAIAVPLAARAQYPWQEELAAEIEALESCEVAFLTQVVEREIDGREVVMAKVHCEDGRSFDASRTERFSAFTFTRCEEPDARSC